MADKINSFCALSCEDQYADNHWWMNVYVLLDGDERDHHMLEFECYYDMMRFRRMIQNTQTPVSVEDTIFVGSYGPILEVEEK
jgi:hypothetical protein